MKKANPWVSAAVVVLMLFSALFSLGASQARADSQQLNWEYLAPPIFEVADLSWNGSILAAVGDRGTIIISEDGANWSLQASGTTNYLYAITSDGSQFVTVGAGGVILSSPDGQAWTQQDSPTVNDLYCITWAGGKFYAGGEQGTLLTSADGVNWLKLPLECPEWTPIRSISWKGDMYLAIAGEGYFTSSDGEDWEFFDYLESPWSQWLQGAETDGSQFVAVGYGGDIYTTADGVEWTGRAPVSFNLYDLAWSGSLFAVVGQSSNIITSAEGESWNSYNTGLSNPSFASIIWAAGLDLFVAVGRQQNMIFVVTSGNGEDWEIHDLANSEPTYGLAWTGNHYVAVRGWSPIYTSGDGSEWTQQGTETYDLYSLAWNGSRLVAVGAGIFVSDDEGLTWTEQTVPDEWYNRVTWTGEKFMVAGCGLILASTTGAVWNVVHEGEYCLYDITWNGSLYVAVGDSGIVITSEDGETWSEQVLELENQSDISVRGLEGSSSPSIYSVTWGQDKFVAVGSTGSWQHGILYTSTDGENWTEALLPGEVQRLNDVTYNGVHFLVVGYNGQVLSSYHGENWSIQSLTPGVELYSIIWHNPFVIGAEAGAVLEIHALPELPTLPVTGPDLGLLALASALSLLAGLALLTRRRQRV